MTDDIDTLLQDLLSKAPSVRGSYAELFRPHSPTIPIPFFGEIDSAKVLTIGLNPSCTELDDRGWAKEIGPSALAYRLRHYFKLDVAPHQWFKKWSAPLAHMDVSYQAGSAAHLDICPWATMPMSQVADQARFTQLVQESVSAFERSLLLAKNARLVLMAGSVNSAKHIDSYLQGIKFDQIELTGKTARKAGVFVRHLKLGLPGGKVIPVFFCSSSPSARGDGPQKFSDRLIEHAHELLPLLE